MARGAVRQAGAISSSRVVGGPARSGPLGGVTTWSNRGSARARARFSSTISSARLISAARRRSQMFASSPGSGWARRPMTSTTIGLMQYLSLAAMLPVRITPGRGRMSRRAPRRPGVGARGGRPCTRSYPTTAGIQTRPGSRRSLRRVVRRALCFAPSAPFAASSPTGSRPTRAWLRRCSTYQDRAGADESRARVAEAWVGRTGRRACPQATRRSSAARLGRARPGRSGCSPTVSRATTASTPPQSTRSCAGRRKASCRSSAPRRGSRTIRSSTPGRAAWSR